MEHPADSNPQVPQVPHVPQGNPANPVTPVPPTPQVPAAPPVLPPAVAPQWIQTEPLEYHRLFRGIARYAWWKPLIATLIALVSYFFLALSYAAILMLPYMFFIAPDASVDELNALALPDTQNPFSLVVSLGSVALMLPAVWFGAWAVGYKPLGRMWSVAGRIRWSLLWRTMLPALGAVVVMNIVGIGLELAISGAGSEDLTPMPDINVTAALWSFALVLLLVPIQSAAEEYVFRGLFMQLLGSWVRSPWVAILVPSVLFGFSHIYDIWGWLAVVAMAVTAGWITWRTGGLEAAVSLHIVNNIVAFGFMAMGAGGSTAQEAEGGGLGSVIGAVVGLALYAWYVDRRFRQQGGIRTRVDLLAPRAPFVPVPGTAPGAAPGPQA